jgi:2-aminobenzoate-CoA ligase
MRLPGGVPSAHSDTFARSLLPPPSLWPQFDYSAEHLRHYPDRINASVALLDTAVAEGFGDRPMLCYEDCVWAYRHLLDRVERLAAVLVKDLGLRPGQRVLLRSANSPMLAACWLAVLRAGGITVPTSAMLRAAELVYVIDKLQIGLALCDVALADEIEAARAACPGLERIAYFSPLGNGVSGQASLDRLIETTQAGAGWVETAADDIAMIVFTSGSTGRPKAAAHFHRDILAACGCWRYPIAIEPGEVMSGTPTMGFTYGITSNLLYPLRYRAASVLVAKPTTENLLAAIACHRISSLCSVPTALLGLLQRRGNHDMSSLTKCFSSGESLRVELWQEWFDATGIRIIEGFGSSELLTRVLSPSAAVECIGSLGKAVPGYTACILDDNGHPLAPGGRGRLGVRGPTGCRYLGDSERQKIAVQNGWNVTSDIFEQDADGYFWYIGRMDDIIVSAGYNISAMEVERVIADHPEVLECAVVGVPDPARGSLVRACIVLREKQGATEETAFKIQDYVKATIAPYKYPRQVKFLDELPKTPSGKVERYRLREV